MPDIQMRNLTSYVCGSEMSSRAGTAPGYGSDRKKWDCSERVNTRPARVMAPHRGTRSKRIRGVRDLKRGRGVLHHPSDASGDRERPRNPSRTDSGSGEPSEVVLESRGPISPAMSPADLGSEKILRSLPRPLMPLLLFLYRVAKYSQSSRSPVVARSVPERKANLAVKCWRASA